MPKKRVNNFFSKQISKCDTCFYMNFSRALQKYRLIAVALVTKKLWAILDFFFTDRTFFPACTQPYKLKKIFYYETSFKLLLIKSHKSHGDSVNIESARTKKTTGGWPPPPACLELRITL